MEVSKIQLSDAESELMQNAELILTKNSVLNKTRQLLEELQDMQLDYVKENGLQNGQLFFVSPKISRGENYLGLPWQILDFPRISTEQGIFFIRSMFWWGRFFSSTLHVSGQFRESIVDQIMASHQHLHEYYISINPDPWAHHFEADNYRRIGDMPEQDFREICTGSSHLKIAAWMPLSAWPQAPAALYLNWKFLLMVGGSVAQSVK